jgi:acylphosphatase
VCAGFARTHTQNFRIISSEWAEQLQIWNIQGGKMAENKQARLHAIVEGEVQGVGFRYFVVERANTLGLTGWVRNRWDDTVEVTAEGEQEALNKLLLHLQKGPSAAYVSGVKQEWQEPTGEFKRFGILPTF